MTAARGGDVPGGSASSWFAGLGVQIPISGRLGADEQARRAAAEAQRIEVEVELRNQYIQLRRKYAALALARKRSEQVADVERRFGARI